MAHPPQAPTQAAGIFIALFTIAGAVIGNANGQPSLGLVLGAGAGIAVALGYWLLKK
jgi:hypothetical protein